jgi:tyrosyl-tRNA synthetase
MPSLDEQLADLTRGAVDVLDRADLVETRKQAWNHVQRDGVTVDGVDAKDPQAQLGPGTYVLRVGKNRFARVTVASG